MRLKDVVKCILGSIRCRVSGVKSGKNVYVGSRVHFECGNNVILGNNVSIRPDCDIFPSEGSGNGIEISDYSDIGTRNRLGGNVRIGKHVLLVPDNYIASVDHCFQEIDVPIMYQGAYEPHRNGHENLSIGDGSWIGCHCAIIGDVHIGKHVVIGANSVVTKDIPDFSVAVGCPARVVKRYDPSKGIWAKVE